MGSQTRFSLALTAVTIAAMGATTPSGAQSEEPAVGLPAALLAQHAAEASCEPLAEVRHAAMWGVHTLTEGFVLYMVPCAAGAYNFSYAFYVGPADRDAFARQLFVDFHDRYGWTGTDQLFNPNFDPETLTLTSFYKLRGIGDCGTSGVWRWDRYAFALTGFYAQSECDLSVEPGDFPQVWPPID